MTSDLVTSITTSLARIRYQYADRTERDIVDALQAYSDLSVAADVYVFSDVGAKELMCVRGTIPVLYRGSTYNIPVAVWLLNAYPSTPPLVRVDLTSDMRINPGRHIDSNGIIYLPYLHEWSYNKCDLVGLLEILTCVFGEEPPVYSASPMTSLTPAAAASRPSRPVQPASSVRSAATVLNSRPTHISAPSFTPAAASTAAQRIPTAASDRASRSALGQQNSYSATRSRLPSLPVTVSRTPVASTSWNASRRVTTAGATAAAAAAPEPEAKTCAVCMEIAVNRVAIIPCGHACLCRQCGEQLQRCVPPLCPMCRRTIQSLLTIYDS